MHIDHTTSQYRTTHQGPAPGALALSKIRVRLTWTPGPVDKHRMPLAARPPLENNGLNVRDASVASTKQCPDIARPGVVGVDTALEIFDGLVVST